MHHPFTRQRLAIGAVLAAMVLAVLDAAIANVALPSLSRSLQVAPAAAVRIVTAYQLAVVMALLPCGALGESWGFRRVFLAGIGLFTAASVLCALSPSLSWLVAARFLQGLGAAAVMSLSVALLRHVVLPQRLGAVIGWNALVVALTSAAGPAIGSLLLAHAPWPVLFALNVPIGLAALAAGRALPDVPGSGRRLDGGSIVLHGTAFAAGVIGAQLLPTTAAWALALCVIAGLALLALVRREAVQAAPLIPIDLLRDGAFRRAVIASVCCFTGQSAGMIALPFFLQYRLGLPALTSGLLLTVWPLGVALIAPWAGRWSDRVSSAWLCAAGTGSLALGLAGLTLTPALRLPLATIALIALCGLGFGLFQTPNNRTMLITVAPGRSGAAGGMQGTARLSGQTAGALLMTLLFAGRAPAEAAHVGLLVGAFMSAVAGAVSLATLERARGAGADAPA